MRDVSLLICTRNRRASLAATLASVAAAARAAPQVAAEAVIVDNGSTDGTGTMLAGWRAAQPFPVRIVIEPRPGLSRARNAGLRAASGRIVAMTDDDCLLHPDYLAALVRRFAMECGPAVIGGRILLGDPADLPMTVKREDHPMAAPPRGVPGGFVMGANLAFTRDAAAAIGPFDERFGAGAPFRAAEDTDFLLRALHAGVTVAYDPAFAVDHHHGRRDPGDAVALLAGYSFGDGALYAKHLFAGRRVAQAIRHDLSDLRRDRTEQPHPAIRRFYLFRLRHKAAGFLAYLRHRGAARAPAPRAVTPPPARPPVPTGSRSRAR